MRSMPTQYTVQEGDCLSSIATAFGFADWRTLYDAPENADFKKKRPNPNIIYPGDKLVIPDKKEKSVDAETGKTHRFKIGRKPTWVRLVVEVHDKHRYLLEVGKASFKGTTDGSSPIAHKIDPEAKQGTLRLWPDTAPDGEDAPDDPPDTAITWALSLGGLDPIEEVSGVKGRLANLGYYAGPIDATVDDDLLAAVRYFRDDQGLEAGDMIDQPLRDKLVSLHDGS